MISVLPPLSLYIHIPWCVKKCPYCDFNSHRIGDGILPEQAYIDQLISDLDQGLGYIQNRPLHSIFIGGGTPSLLSATAMDRLLTAINQRWPWSADVEVTMEANPGVVEQAKFSDFNKAGINRLSLGIQSFQDTKLKKLGRIHDGDTAKKAIVIARNAGFNNINLDLMHGLEDQSVDDAIEDLQTALAFKPEHLSWYQLTIEPRTVFAKHRPRLPSDDRLWQIENQGQQLLETNDFSHYEISAYARKKDAFNIAMDYRCRHNLNYWCFGDYLGIGAGAHSKITDLCDNKVLRFHKKFHPRAYLTTDISKKQSFIAEKHEVHHQALVLEFMMNSLRLKEGVSIDLFEARTGLPYEAISKIITEAKQQGLLMAKAKLIQASEKGQLFLNDCLALFTY